MEYFADLNNNKVLKAFLGKLDRVSAVETFQVNRNSHIYTIIDFMQRKPAEWDSFCEMNIGWIGDSFIERLSSYNEANDLDEIFVDCFRFLFELYLSMSSDLSMELSGAYRFGMENIDNFNDKNKEQIEFAIREMPISIFKRVANSEGIKSVRQFNETAAKAEKMEEEWEKDLSSRELRVGALKTALSEYETGFNFVKLFDGFNNLSTDKRKEKDILLVSMFALGVIIISPLVFELAYIFLNLKSLTEIRNVMLISLIPTASLMGLLIYFFRIILHNYKSVKSQLLQIELRKTLCQFIEAYSDYAKEMKGKDGSSLEKFENIIFSGIVSVDENMPSTYDGIEQVGKLIKSMK